MRVIKFRAWDKWKSQMIQPNDGDFIGWHAMSNWKDCLDVMQFTGLTDANGVEIYEGDIVRHAGFNVCHKITYESYFAKYAAVDLFSGCCEDMIKDVCSESMIVVGNIHQNPELLEANDV